METSVNGRRITERIGGGIVDLRCGSSQVSWGDTLDGSLQLCAGSKPLRVQMLRVGLRPAFWTGQWSQPERAEAAYWTHLTVPRQRTKTLPFSVSIWRGLPFGEAMLLVADVRLVGQKAGEVGLWVTISPPAELTAFVQLLQDTVALSAPEWSTLDRSYDVLVTFTPEAPLGDRLEEVTLKLRCEPEAVSGELLLNERERTAADFLRAARGKDRRVLPFRWALGDTDSARMFFAQAFRPYVEALAVLPLPASAASGPVAQLPVPATGGCAAPLDEFLLPPAVPVASSSDPDGLRLPENKAGHAAS
jgi:hypothetical protein